MHEQAREALGLAWLRGRCRLGGGGGAQPVRPWQQPDVSCRIPQLLGQGGGGGQAFIILDITCNKVKPGVDLKAIQVSASSGRWHASTQGMLRQHGWRVGAHLVLLAVREAARPAVRPARLLLRVPPGSLLLLLLLLLARSCA